jgi:N-acyl-D-amino-acid deacylase
MKMDLTIKNGYVFDGAGNPAKKTDVGIHKGRIVQVGAISDGEAGRTIDASGLAVAPGFIDMHNHVDNGVLAFPSVDSYIMQGVTTSVTGNCGASMAPLEESTMEMSKRYLAPFVPSSKAIDWKWKSYGEYMKAIEKNGIAQNLAFLVGQGTIRIAVKGFDPSRAVSDEIDRMKTHLSNCIEEGVFGLSSGLIYPPGSFTETEELFHLAEVLALKGGIYTTHLRNEGNHLSEAVEEALEIGARWNIPIQLSHHKAVGRPNWGKVHHTLRMMEEAREKGVDVCCDVYPYTAASTTVTSLLPPFAHEGGIHETLRRLRDAEERYRMAAEISHGSGGWENWITGSGLHNIFISDCPIRPDLEGRHLKEIIQTCYPGKDEMEGLFDLLSDIQCLAKMNMFAMDEEDVKTVLAHPLSCVASDSWVSAPYAGGKPHPRGYGTFPRFLRRYVLDGKLMSLQEGVRKITSMPASRLGLQGRGLLKEGFHADVTVFNPSEICDTATFTNPHQFPKGISYVIVNGELVVNEGQLTERKPGHILRKN